MAGFKVSGIDELCLAFEKSAEVPKSVKEDILKAMAEVALKRQKEKGESMGVRSTESTVHILDNMKINKPKITDSEGKISITFKGSRTDKKHKTPTRNAEIAFINEFGKEGQPARPFIKTALDMYGDEINNAGLKVFESWQDSLFNK